MKSRNGIIANLATLLLFIGLEVLSFVLISNNSVIQRYRIMSSIRDVQSYVWNKRVGFMQFLGYKTENERLWEENVTLRQQLENIRSYQFQNDYDSIEFNPDFTYLQARVIKSFTNRQHNCIILNKGQKEGIKEGMGVVTGRGIIGIVNAVSENYAQLISFLNIEQSISAKVLKSGEFGPMVWSGDAADRAIIREIPIHSDVAPGDTIVSSGFSSIYPAEIPIGTVYRTEEVNGVSKNLFVTLFENFKALDRVYVVRSNHIDEINELIDGNAK